MAEIDISNEKNIDEKYIYVTPYKRIFVSDFLLFVIVYFKQRKSQKLLLWEIINIFKKNIKLDKINYSSIIKLLNPNKNNLVDFENVLNTYSEKTSKILIFDNIPETFPKIELELLKRNNNKPKNISNDEKSIVNKINSHNNITDSKENKTPCNFINNKNSLSNAKNDYYCTQIEDGIFKYTNYNPRFLKKNTIEYAEDEWFFKIKYISSNQIYNLIDTIMIITDIVPYNNFFNIFKNFPFDFETNTKNQITLKNYHHLQVTSIHDSLVFKSYLQRHNLNKCENKQIFIIKGNEDDMFIFYLYLINSFAEILNIKSRRILYLDIIKRLKKLSDIEFIIPIKNFNRINKKFLEKLENNKIFYIGDLKKINIIDFSYDELNDLNKIINILLKFKSDEYYDSKKDEYKTIESLTIKDAINNLLSTLTIKEEIVIRLRYGVNEQYKKYTLDRIGDKYNITREAVRQIEQKALEKLRQPSRIKYLNKMFDYLYLFRQNDYFYTDMELKTLGLYEVYPLYLSVFNEKNLNISQGFHFYKCKTNEDFEELNKFVNYYSSLPDEIEDNDLDIYIDNVIKNLSKNINHDQLKLFYESNYIKNGDMYSINKLSLPAKFKILLKKYFHNPVNIYDKHFISLFRKYYDNEFGDKDLGTDHAISSILSKIGMLVGRGLYVLNNKNFMSQELANKIYMYIKNSGRDTFLTNNLFAIFKNELLSEGINNKYFMQGALKQRFKNTLYFKRDYISTTKEITPIYSEIYKFIKENKGIVKFSDLKKNFIGIPNNIIFMAVSQKGILNYFAKYIHVDNLNLTNENINFLRNTISSMTSDGEIHHTKELLFYINSIDSHLLNSLFIEDQFSLFSLIEYYFNKEFNFKRPFFSQNETIIINQTERIKEFIGKSSEMLLDSIFNFVYTNKLRLYSICEFVDSLDNYIFKDEKSIISIKKSNINKYNTEIAEKMILQTLGDDEFIFADKLSVYPNLPKEVTWTPWLLYSAINKYGSILKAIPSDTLFRKHNITVAKPIIIRKEISVNNIDELIEYLKIKTGLDSTDFYDYLKEKGLT